MEAREDCSPISSLFHSSCLPNFFSCLFYTPLLFPWNSPSFSRPPRFLPRMQFPCIFAPFFTSYIFPSCHRLAGLFGRESAKKRTYLSRLLIVLGLTREAEGKARWLLFEIERENLIVVKGDCSVVCFVCTLFINVFTLLALYYLGGKLELIEIFDIFFYFFLFTYRDKYGITTIRFTRISQSINCKLNLTYRILTRIRYEVHNEIKKRKKKREEENLTLKLS